MGLTLMFALSLPASAQPTPDGEGDWLARSRAILQAVQEAPIPDWLRTTPGVADLTAARAIAQGAGVAVGCTDPPAAELAPGTVLLFASFSLPEPTLRSLLGEARRPGVVLVLRGLPEGADLREGYRRLASLIDDLADPPNVVIDPTLFRQHGVTVVPTLILRDGETEPVRVRGAVTVAWLRARAGRLPADASRDLGRYGETYPIAEPDLIEALQRRLAAIDWAARREAAIEGFWRDHAVFVDLPPAVVDRTFEVDPTVEVSTDIIGPDGRVLVARGTRFNPLGRVPLTKAVLVFDATDPRQRARAAAIAEDVRAAERGLVLITTRIERDNGWARLAELETSLAGPVYLLTASLAQALRLERVPALIEARGLRLQVREIAVAVGEGVQ